MGLDPARASRKFNEQKQIDDPSVARAEVEALKAANRLERVKEVDEDMEKIKTLDENKGLFVNHEDPEFVKFLYSRKLTD